MTQREFSHESHLPIAQAGTIASISAVTKAITAFACLQAVTHNRSMKRIKDRVLCDAIVGSNQSLNARTSVSRSEAPKQLLVETERPLRRSISGRSTPSRRRSAVFTEETAESVEERKAVVEATPWPANAPHSVASASLDSLKQSLAEAEDLPAHIKQHNANLSQYEGGQRYHLTLKSMTTRVNRHRKRSHSTQHFGSDNDSIASIDTFDSSMQHEEATPSGSLSKAYQRVKGVFGGRSRKRMKSAETDASTTGDSSTSDQPHQYEEASIGVDQADDPEDCPSGEEEEYQHATFPEGHYAHNLRKYMRYSSAAYGHLFMNLMGINREYKHEALSSQHANNVSLVSNRFHHS